MKCEGECEEHIIIICYFINFNDVFSTSWKGEGSMRFGGKSTICDAAAVLQVQADTENE